MLFEQILFLVVALGATGGALGVVMLRNPFYSVLALIVHLISLAILFLLLSAAFLAAAQVVVYAGAVMVLYLFVVAYVGGTDEELLVRPRRGGFTALLAPLFAFALLVELTIAVVGSSLTLLDGRGPDVPDDFGTPAAIGDALLTKYLLVFEAASFLLLIAAVGAVMIASRQRGHQREEDAVSVADLVRKTDVGDQTEAT